MRVWENKKIHGAVFLSLLVSFFIVKYYGPAVITGLYENGRMDVLNAVTYSQGEHSANYYAGRADETLLGPISSLLAGSLLLGLCFLYFKKTSAPGFFAVIFFYLIATRPEVLFYPPYGDAVTGIFFDVMWIARHSFDYIGLFHQNNFVMGGPQMYPVSLFPSLLAFLMQITPSTRAFLLVSHVLIFACAAGSAAVLREMMRRVFGDGTAMIAAILLVSLPIFQSMSELVNMEMPLTFFSVLSIAFLLDRKIGPAAVFSAAAFLVKASGAITGLAVFAGSVLMTVSDARAGGRTRNLVYGLAAGVFAAAMLALRKARTGTAVATNNIAGFWLGAPGIAAMPSFWVYLGLTAVFVYGCVVWFKTRQDADRTLPALIRAHFPALVVFMVTGLWFLAFANFLVTIDRYKILLAPFFIFCVVSAATVVIRNRRILNTVLAVVTGVFFLCSHGYWGQRHFTGDYYSGHERSLEYRNTLKRDMRVARYLEENFSGKMIAAPFVPSYILNFAELGYVSRPMIVTLYGMLSNHEEEGVYNFQALEKMDLNNTIWLGYPDHVMIQGMDYPVGPDDQVITEIESGNKKMVVFRGGFAVETLRRIVEAINSGLL